jgi:hypothetical protein
LPGQLAKYAAVAANERLRQGEILVGLIQVRQSVNSIGSDAPQINEITHPFVVVMTQDCDLEQDSRLRTETGQGSLVNVLFCEAMATTELKSKLPPGKDIWKRIVQNKDERYQCLEEVPAAQDTSQQGIPCLGCDLKRYFTVPTDEVYKRVELGQIMRRTRLITPYAEHLLHRFCNFQARIPLPENHDVPT